MCDPGALHVQQGQQESGGTPHAEFQDPGTQEEENPHRCAAKSFSGDLCGARGPREEGCAAEDNGETMAWSFRREKPQQGSLRWGWEPAMELCPGVGDQIPLASRGSDQAQRGPAGGAASREGMRRWRTRTPEKGTPPPPSVLNR